MSDTLNNAKVSTALLWQLLGKRNYQILLVLAFVATLFFGNGLATVPEDKAASSQASPAVQGDSSEALVVRVVDGDTFEIEGGERVRLIGIDTPETVNPNTKIECFGKESSEYLKTLIEGKRVRLERDRTDRDRYARLLRYAYLGDIFVNEVLVRDGYAESVAYKPDTAKQEVLDRAENSAQQEGKGRWNPAACSE